MKLMPAMLALLVAGAAHAETMTGQFFICHNVETLNRVSAMVRSGDKAAAARFIKQQIASGECADGPAVGSKVRVQQRRLGRVCIAPFDSVKPCQWTYSNVVE